MVARSNAATPTGGAVVNGGGADDVAAAKGAKFGGVSFLTLLSTQVRRVARETQDALRPSSILGFLRRHALGLALFAVGAGLLGALCGTAWKSLGGDAFYVLAWLYLSCAAMVAEVAQPDVCLFFACLMYMVKGIIAPKDTFAGLSNDSIVTIALMIGIAAGIEATGALDYLSHYMLSAGMSTPPPPPTSKRPDSAGAASASAAAAAEDGREPGASGGRHWFHSSLVQRNVAKVRMFTIVAAISGFINNTPLVAVMIPTVERFCRRFRMPTSQYMMPLSYAAISGGLITIIGTSTNLIVKGFAEDPKDGFPGVTLSFFEIGAVGAPLTVAALIYYLVASPWLLPKVSGVINQVAENPRRYTVGLRVGKQFPALGQSIVDAGLRSLPGLFLVDLERADGTAVAAPGPSTVVLAGDVLTFAGDVESVHTALNTPGLTVEAGVASYLADEATLAGGGALASGDTGGVGSGGGALAAGTAALTSDKNSDLGADDEAAAMDRRGGRALVEAVVGVSSPLVGKTVRASGFRTRYGGSIIAVHRGAERVYGRIGDIQLRVGDSLLVEAPPDFVERYRHHRDFALVSSPFVPDSVKHDPLRILFSLGAFIAMIAINSADVQELSVTAMLVLYSFFFTRVLTPDEFRSAIPGQVLLMVASGFGVAQALRNTGLAKQIGSDIFGAFTWMGPYGSVFATYLATEIMTILLSNGAAVTILFPIVRSIAAAQGGTVAPKAYLYALALAGSSDFMTPTGYQTNSMVAGPGGYKFVDFLRFGTPLQVVFLFMGSGLSYLIFG